MEVTDLDSFDERYDLLEMMERCGCDLILTVSLLLLLLLLINFTIHRKKN